MIQTPVQIASRGFTLPPWWREKILRKASKLEEFHPRITACRVVVESSPQHPHKGRQYKLRVDVEVPRGFIVINREPAGTLNEAIDRAFDAAERRLEDRMRLIRREVKRHEAPPRARVSRLFPDADCGFLETADGREVYFHRHSVLGDGFKRLTPGTEVRFHEEAGEKGPQASTVAIVKAAPRAERRRGVLRRAQSRA